MLTIQNSIPLAPKATLRIGGTARYYAELKSKEDVKDAYAFAKEKDVPLIILGGGSNTIFAEGEINALVVKVVADEVVFDKCVIPSLPRDEPLNELHVTVQSGTFLASLINECAQKNLDLSPLTGIPGTVGGAIFGNAGQGFGGTWIDSFIESVDVFIDGTWKTMTKDECEFGYRTSIFKNTHALFEHDSESSRPSAPLQARGERDHVEKETSLIFSTTLTIPSRPQQEITSDIDHLLKRRLETQPHRKTAGSCFLSLDKEIPAWKLIDAAGLRGHQIGGMKVSEKHANFLINEGGATFEDAKMLVDHIQKAIPEELSVEMRFIGKNGTLEF